MSFFRVPLTPTHNDKGVGVGGVPEDRDIKTRAKISTGIMTVWLNGQWEVVGSIDDELRAPRPMMYGDYLYELEHKR